MITKKQIEIEAQKFRGLLELKKYDDIPHVTEDFPVMNCKLASLLFAYHILNKWHDEIIYGVSGSAKNNNGDDTISHYWLEIGEIAVDITADQYNEISNSLLNKSIIKTRPFQKVYVDKAGRIPTYSIFDIKKKDRLLYNFPDFHDDFIEDLITSHDALMRLI
ncbi:hypothetical protein [Serratia fonticola]|uniref:hypothetical protein n=1 Tax=Serratia fonticola TaxID=47917 RepID=UPI002DBA9C87|nr:hypothetical protein [Serratia fonticola]MEB7884355.1 hypothetical protein [Serratia fonticola]